MANAPHRTDPFGLHIADRALKPIISSSEFSSAHSNTSWSRKQFQSLSSLTATAISAHDTAVRLSLGSPQRIMVETDASGPIVLTSYLHPSDRSREALEQPGEELLLLGEPSDGNNAIEEPVRCLEESAQKSRVVGIGEFEQRNRPPLLIATVVAPGASWIGDARRSAARLEKAGRDFQTEWTGRLTENSTSAFATTSGGKG